MDEWPEAALMDLLAMVRGLGRWRIMGEGIHTYPQGDENNLKLYRACCELERRGLIFRAKDEPQWVFWRPVASINNPPTDRPVSQAQAQVADHQS
jgi:hypothetical protein